MTPPAPLAAFGILLGFAGPALGAAPVATTGTAGRESFSMELTLEEATERAMQHSPDAIAALGERRIAAAGQRTAYGSFLPSVNADAGASRSQTTRTEDANGGAGDPRTNYSAGVSASWDVFTGFRRGAEMKSASAAVESAEAGLVEQRFAVAFAVEQAWFDVVRAEELAEVATARIGRAEQALSASERRSQVGSATRSDILRARLELNQARDSLLQQRTDRRSAAYALGVLVGADGPVGAKRTGIPESRPLSVTRDTLLDELVAKTPSVRAAEASLLTSEAGLASARAAYAPQVGLSTGYDVSDDPERTGWGASWSARVGVSIPIFDGFAREESMTRARVNLATARARLADTKRATRAEIARLLDELELQEQRVALASEAVEVAAEDVRVQQERYGLGVTTFLELLTSQESLVEAQNGLVEARFTYRLARTSLETVAGRKL